MLFFEITMVGSIRCFITSEASHILCSLFVFQIADTSTFLSKDFDLIRDEFLSCSLIFLLSRKTTRRWRAKEWPGGLQTQKRNVGNICRFHVSQTDVKDMLLLLLLLMMLMMFSFKGCA